MSHRDHQGRAPSRRTSASRGARRPALRPVLAVAVAAVSVLAACTPPPVPEPPPEHTGGVDPSAAPRADEPAYAERGPHDVGVITVEVEPGRSADVWYPAPGGSADGLATDVYRIRTFLAPILQQFLPASVDPPFTTEAVRDLPALEGRFPLVLFSHGFASFRLQSTFLTTHLASWGFVVISPDYFERGLQSFGGTPPAPTRSDLAVAQLAVEAAERLDAGPGPLAGRIDTSRLFPVGHSAGGGTSTQLAGTRTDVSSWIAMSSGINLTPTLFNPTPRVPAALGDPDKAVMWITGEDDGVARLAGVEDAYRYSAGEKKLVVVPRSGHNNAMSDICEIGRADGGVIGLARKAGLPLPDFLIDLAQDGCLPPNVEGPEVWPVVRHFITAELRYRSGLDAEPVGLGEGVVDAFGALAPTYEEAS